MCRYSRKPIGHDLQRVGDSYAGAFSSVVYCDYPSHIRSQRYYKIGCNAKCEFLFGTAAIKYGVALHRVNIVIDDGLFHPWVVKRLFVDASQYLFYFRHRCGIFHF